MMVIVTDQLGDVFQKIPESKAWYLEYIEDHQLSIPDEVVPVLQAQYVCFQQTDINVPHELQLQK